mmetsp:Transcript_40594/g.83036  ORF Transcript_40594/g.83036 Transcript_40594/m.83036 type:complete len:366 (-) Transcript_40594:416-1513(-)|eukprot:CAMPEP_0181305990 /NCGR_PEP_ID=MMETSP1101-20121128/10045_1 /TAXON_ID=46948 /ORGANISM="Rhodomonas abbreviata, Strain Caron Lab Isolate" /LENGTH=365 /DNA_ID=CAMNT_0023411985 /DNA_START=108 /DNA_END=1205 /DNA_ORIENTATION=-
MTAGWSTIESDPGVFTQLSQDLGIRGTQVEEIVTMEDSEFASLAPIYGFIFLFKWTQEMAKMHTGSSTCVENHNLYFAKQVINNACGTQALLNIMMNAEGIQLGDELTNFKSFTADFPPDLKGEAMSNSDMIRVSHNSFARPEPFEMEERTATKEDDVYHFTAYMPVGGKLWELDGLQQGPILLGDLEPDAPWWRKVVPMLQERIQRYSATEIRFNLLAVCQNKRQASLGQLGQLRAKSNMLRAALLSHGIDPPEDDGMELGESEEAEAEGEPEDCTDQSPEQLQEALSECQVRAAQLRQVVGEEEERACRYQRENARRRHNFVPFIFQLLQGLAKEKALGGLMKEAEAKAQKREEQQRASKAAQ